MIRFITLSCAIFMIGQTSFAAQGAQQIDAVTIDQQKMVAQATAEAEAIKQQATLIMNDAREQLLNNEINPIECARIIREQNLIIAQAQQKLKNIITQAIENVEANDVQQSYVGALISGVLAPFKAGYGYSEQEKAIAGLMVKGLNDQLKQIAGEYDEKMSMSATPQEQASLVGEYDQIKKELEQEIYQQQLITGEAMSTSRKLFWATVAAGGTVAGIALASKYAPSFSNTTTNEDTSAASEASVIVEPSVSGTPLASPSKIVSTPEVEVVQPIIAQHLPEQEMKPEVMQDETKLEEKAPDYYGKTIEDFEGLGSGGLANEKEKQEPSEQENYNDGSSTVEDFEGLGAGGLSFSKKEELSETPETPENENRSQYTEEELEQRVIADMNAAADAAAVDEAVLAGNEAEVPQVEEKGLFTRVKEGLSAKNAPSTMEQRWKEEYGVEREREIAQKAADEENAQRVATAQEKKLASRQEALEQERQWQAEIDAEQAEKTAIQEALIDMKRQEKMLSQELKSAHKETTSKTQELKKLETELSRAQNAIVPSWITGRRTIDTIKQDVDVVSQAVALARANEEEKTEQLTGIQQEIQTKPRVARNRATIGAWQQERRENKEYVAEMKAEKNDLMSTIKSSRGEQAKLTQELSDLESERIRATEKRSFFSLPRRRPRNVEDIDADIAKRQQDLERAQQQENEKQVKLSDVNKEITSATSWW